MTKTEIQTIITALKTAYSAIVSGGAEYTITVGGSTRRFRHHDLTAIRNEINYWEDELAKYDSDQRGIQIKFGTPHR